MAVVDTTILELLGKQVSFTRSFEKIISIIQ